jgi:hypothetical protein
MLGKRSIGCLLAWAAMTTAAPAEFKLALNNWGSLPKQWRDARTWERRPESSYYIDARAKPAIMKSFDSPNNSSLIIVDTNDGSIRDTTISETESLITIIDLTFASYSAASKMLYMNSLTPQGALMSWQMDMATGAAILPFLRPSGDSQLHRYACSPRS